jgi:hypothetical protein
MTNVQDKKIFLSSFHLQYNAMENKPSLFTEVTSLKNPPELNPLYANVRYYGEKFC